MNSLLENNKKNPLDANTSYNSNKSYEKNRGIKDKIKNFVFEIDNNIKVNNKHRDNNSSNINNISVVNYKKDISLGIPPKNNLNLKSTLSCYKTVDNGYINKSTSKPHSNNNLLNFDNFSSNFTRSRQEGKLKYLNKEVITQILRGMKIFQFHGMR